MCIILQDEKREKETGKARNSVKVNVLGGSPVRFAFLASTRVLVLRLSPTTASRADSRTEYIPVSCLSYPIRYPYPSVCDRSKPELERMYHVYEWRLSKVSWTIANFFIDTRTVCYKIYVYIYTWKYILFLSLNFLSSSFRFFFIFSWKISVNREG